MPKEILTRAELDQYLAQITDWAHRHGIAIGLVFRAPIVPEDDCASVDGFRTNATTEGAHFLFAKAQQTILDAHARGAVGSSGRRESILHGEDGRTVRLTDDAWEDGDNGKKKQTDE